jgi:hypothetical protein
MENCLWTTFRVIRCTDKHHLTPNNNRILTVKLLRHLISFFVSVAGFLYIVPFWAEVLIIDSSRFIFFCHLVTEPFSLSRAEHLFAFFCKMSSFCSLRLFLFVPTGPTIPCFLEEKNLNLYELIFSCFHFCASVYEFGDEAFLLKIRACYTLDIVISPYFFIREQEVRRILKTNGCEMLRKVCDKIDKFDVDVLISRGSYLLRTATKIWFPIKLPNSLSWF